ncbi:MAG: prepilin-type N-terminal cleavage/methylation domain-containing protein [Gemmatimonadaceae bacterium]|nr:prepilin-type N-terminal cleavage/methylation domain-containing protein [Gemmatimonadaceae bacterium]
MSRNSRGFTFAEILVAMVVFGALTAIAVPRYRTFKERAFIASMKTDLGSLRVAEEAFWAEHMTYSADTAQLDWNGSSLVNVSITSGDFNHGFAALATHASAPSMTCQTFVGREATTTASGDIICSPAAGLPPGSALTP